MCQHPACTAETRIRSKDCDVTIADRMGSRDAFPIPFPSFIYGVTGHFCGVEGPSTAINLENVVLFS